MTDLNKLSQDVLVERKPSEQSGYPGINGTREIADGMIIDYDASIRKHNGVIIRADIYRRDGNEPVPPLLVWSPYGTHGPVTSPGTSSRAARWRSTNCRVTRW